MTTNFYDVNIMNNNYNSSHMSQTVIETSYQIELKEHEAKAMSLLDYLWLCGTAPKSLY